MTTERVTTERMMTERRARSAPVSVARGAPAVIGAWIVALAVARLTGAAAVVLLLVASAVAIAAAAVSGWWRLRAVRVTGIVCPTIATAGDEFRVVVAHHDTGRSSGRVVVRVLGRARPLDDSPTALAVSVEHAGVLDALDVAVESAGVAGLVTWRRRRRHRIEPLHVAARACGPMLPVEQASSPTQGTHAMGTGPRVGDLDGMRPWRPGEAERAIHWPSTLRSGELIAHDRSSSTECRWAVASESEPGRLRWTLLEGLRRGHEVTVIDGDQATTREEIPVRHDDDAARWSAIVATRRATPPTTIPLRRRPRPSRREPDTEGIGASARVSSGVAALVSIWMLLGALRGGTSGYAFVTFGIVVATTASLRYREGQRPWWTRAIVAFIATAALGRIAVQASGIGGLVQALRGPLPDLLMLLVVLHGAEIADRRTNRVHLAITGVVVAFASGLRIDGTVGWWLLAWGAVTVASFCATERRSDKTSRRTSVGRAAGWTAVGAACTIGLASFVPIPDGPASLGLPALAADGASQVGEGGSLVGPGGAPSQPTSPADPTRGSLGRAGGYPGFSEVLDTAVRGSLGDEVVMRVRAPEPAFWRGQTFTDFDGRTWTVDDDRGRRIDGPTIRLEPTLGDVPDEGVATEEFVQTFNVESDLPNVIFAASTPTTVIFDGSVFARADGALRADRTLAEGTVYSVVSERAQVTADDLRAQGDLSDWFEPVADSSDVAPFLALPDSTSRRTVELARDRRVEGSTYDTIRAYESWLALNTAYDLNAPVPDGDAVDDFLFGSQRGFCEQIASSLVVMLRSQGVPARLATGYVPGERDQISGVFEVRASDAHAWVEVWFPATGWEAFDPTVTVPLAGEADRSTVGADAASAMIDAVTSRPVEAGAVVVIVSFVGATLRWLAEWRRRRVRGAWGILHDRFMALAPGAITAPQAAIDLAERLGTNGSAPGEVARTLDRVAFDPDYVADDRTRRALASDIAAIERDLTTTASRRVPAVTTS